MIFERAGETLAYHAARLLLLIHFCGKPRGGRGSDLPGIEGRTLLAKLDFFLRYPVYLRKAAAILKKKLTDENFGLSADSEVRSVESRMVRYLYGPWDYIYYPTIAYLIGKELVTVEIRRNVEIFRLTPKGQDVAKKLAHESVYTDLAQRADTAYHLFNKYSGSRLKEFIYANFPEVVNRDVGALI